MTYVILETDSFSLLTSVIGDIPLHHSEVTTINVTTDQHHGRWCE